MFFMMNSSPLIIMLLTSVIAVIEVAFYLIDVIVYVNINFTDIIVNFYNKIYDSIY